MSKHLTTVSRTELFDFDVPSVEAARYQLGPLYHVLSQVPRGVKRSLALGFGLIPKSSHPSAPAVPDIYLK